MRIRPKPNPKDSVANYFNFNTRHHGCELQGIVYRHRLGAFFTPGGGMRQTGAIPAVGVLHVPVYDAGRSLGPDPSAEVVAKYLANPPENYDIPKHGARNGSTHASSDRDSFVLLLPYDGDCWGCGNFYTARSSWEIEIAGTGEEKAAYWKTDDARLKLVQAARAHIASCRLVFTGDDWKGALIPRQVAKLDNMGNVLEPGWTQHRDVPYFDKRKGVFVPYPDNLLAGQHYDICEDFPFDFWFQILEEEIAKA